jgi:hypothetical protein
MVGDGAVHRVVMATQRLYFDLRLLQAGPEHGRTIPLPDIESRRFGPSCPSPDYAPATPGRRTVNTDPLPGSLVTVTSPPIMRASLREMASSRPVQPFAAAETPRRPDRRASRDKMACCSHSQAARFRCSARSVFAGPS